MGPEAGRLPVRLGRYTLVRSLGAGGMAELFLARADGIGGFAKLVALKRILKHKATNERFIRMLLNEARLVATLDHPNIAAVHDIGFEDGEYFFAMEYVHGQDLRRVLREAPSRQLHLENALHVAIGVCAGLHHAHEARDPSGRSLELVHRDVSPSNVLVSYQGAVKLVDFGVAKAATLVSETREGVVKGKYGYLSPEQCLGAPLDRRSDLFAVGILLWEMTVGRRLYKLNGELATLQRVVYVDAPRPSRFIRDYPPELERIVVRALARDPERRYQTAEQLQLELEAFALEHRLPVSAVSMGMEMRRLFRDRIDAWREAEQAGRSLAEHLAEVSSEDAVASSDVDGAGAAAGMDLDEALAFDEPGDDPTAPVTLPGTFQRPPTVTQAPEAPEAPEAPQPAPAAAPDARGQPRRRGRWWAALAALAILGSLGAAWALWRRRPDEAPGAVAAEPTAVAAVASDADVDAPGDAEEAPLDEVVFESIDAGAASPEPAGAKRAKRDRRPPKAGRRVAATTPKAARDAKGANGAKGARDAEDAEDPEDAEDAEDPKGARSSNGSTDERASNGSKAAQERDAAVRTPDPPAARATAVQAPAPHEPRPGTVDPGAVRAVVRAHLAEIETCVARARMEDRDLKGTIVLRIALAGSGRVTGASVASSKGASPGLEACMIKAVATWPFPAPAGGAPAAIRYPFSF